MPPLFIRAINLVLAPLEMMFATLLFANKYSRRRLWWLWLILGVGVILGACFLLSYVKSIILASVDVLNFNLGNFAFSCFLTAVIDLILFGMYGITVFAVFDIKKGSVAYISCACFLIENTARCLYLLFLMARNPDEQAMLASFRDAVNVVMYLAIYVAVFVSAYYAFVRKYAGVDDGDIIKRISVPLVIIIFINLFMGGINAPRDNPWASTIYLCLLVSRFFLCGIGLVLQFFILNWHKMKIEQSTLQQIMYQQKEQYEIAKESIDTVNINAHDLRKQINMILNSVRASGETNIVESELSGMMDSIALFDTAYRTGNTALDVTLTEKARSCLKRKIKLSTIADGNCIAFMSDIDIYALFGNALDNAIEAVENIEDEDERIISFSVRKENGIVSVHVENTYSTPPEFKNGLPQTIKNDKHVHGYGVKSMINISKKYGGNLTMKAKNGMFFLDIIIPIKDI